MKSLILPITTMLLFTSCSAQNKNSEFSAKAISLAKKNICNPAFMETKEWNDFVAYLNSDGLKDLSQEDYVTAFNERSNKLPFSHFYMWYDNTEKEVETKKKMPFELEEVDAKTTILYLRKFVANAEGMVKIVQELASKNYENLIIDLRNNGGGTLDAAVVLGQYLTSKPIDAGAYITRGWFEKEGRYPTMEEVQSFPYLKEMTLDGFNEAKAHLAFRMVLPPHNKPTFQGKVYVLANEFSGSASEPFVHVLKTQMNATVVGETTAGAMLSAEWFVINEKISLFIPVTDYVTAEGNKLDRIGVKPHIQVDSEKALDEVLKVIAE